MADSRDSTSWIVTVGPNGRNHEQQAQPLSATRGQRRRAIRGKGRGDAEGIPLVPLSVAELRERPSSRGSYSFVCLLFLVRGVLAVGSRGIIRIAESIASAFDRDQFGMLQEAIENRRGRRHIPNQLAPIFQGTVGGHHGAPQFVSTHDDPKTPILGYVLLWATPSPRRHSIWSILTVFLRRLRLVRRVGPQRSRRPERS